VDTHTEGEPTRIITGGIGHLAGSSITEKRDFFRRNLDHLRTALVLEPRGHRDMFGCVLTEPAGPDAEFGMFFMDGGGYQDMCGHATIGVSTALVELGMVAGEGPGRRIRFETPAGPVESAVAVQDGRAVSVTFRGVPSFVEHRDAALAVPGIGDLKVDVAYGGNWFVYVDADALGLEVSLSNIREVVDVGMRTREAANRSLPVRHPEIPGSAFINIATVLARPEDPAATYRNVHVFGPGQFDRSPGGTGNCARLAVLHLKDELGPDARVQIESVTGGMFVARMLGETRVGDRNAIVPEITGSAHVTGFHQFPLDPRDRLGHGFSTGSA
jgi:proline racemase